MLWIYWCGFLLYSVLVIYLGWRAFQADRTAAANLDFWAANRSLGAWATGLSISASFMSISWSCVYAVQLAYWYGLSALWLLAVPWLVAMIFYYVLTPHFRKFPAFSQPEMIADRFGDDTRIFFALPLAFVFLVWGGAEIYAAAHILSPILQVSRHVVLALIALVVATYSYLGGFSAVVVTDKLQFGLVAFFVLAIAWVAGNAALSAGAHTNLAGGMPAPPHHGKPAFSFFAAGLPLIVMTLVAYLPGWIVETDIWVRLQAARSNRAARRGVIIAGCNSVLFLGILPMLIGLATLALYPPTDGVIPAELQDGAAIFAVLIQNHTPALLSVLLIIGLIAASMSTIDTCGNVMALSLSYDVAEPLLKNRPIDRRRVARLISAGAILLAYVYALFTESLWDIFYLSSGILTTTLFIPMVALFKRRSTKRQVQSAAVAGFVSTLVLYVLESRGMLSDFQPDWLSGTGLGYIVWGLGISLAGYVVSGRLSGNGQRQ